MLQSSTYLIYRMVVKDQEVRDLIAKIVWSNPRIQEHTHQSVSKLYQLLERKFHDLF